MALNDLDEVFGRCRFKQGGGGPKTQGKHRQPAETEGEGQRRRTDEDVFGRHFQHFARIAVGDDQEVAVKMHRRLGLARGARREAEQRHIIAAGAHRFEAHGFRQRCPVEFSIVVGGAVKADDAVKEAALLAARDEVFHQPRVAERVGDFSFVDNLGQFASAQHRHGVDDHRTRLGGGQPAGDHRRIIGRADQHPVAGLHTIITDQRVGDAVRPVRQFLVGAAAAHADQRYMVAESLVHHLVCEFDGGVQPFGIDEMPKLDLRPQIKRRKIVAREVVAVAARSQLHGHVLLSPAAQRWPRSPAWPGPRPAPPPAPAPSPDSAARLCRGRRRQARGARRGIRVCRSQTR